MPLGTPPFTIFGTTQSGDELNDGTIWEWHVGQNSSPIISSFGFDGTDGADPASGVIVDPGSGGDLVGTTLAGGASNAGVIFDNDNLSLVRVVSFTGLTGNGAAPSGLVSDASGNLFGVAHTGTVASPTVEIFELANGSVTITPLATVSGQFNGSQLLIDSSGDLFGALSVGAAGAKGSVFELVKGASSVKNLATFSTADEPYLDLSMDGSGNLFGATFGNSRSTIFEVVKGSGVVTTRSVLSSGMLASGGVVIDPSGNLYGSATGGAAGANGIIFESGSGSGTVTTLASFNGTNGTAPTEPTIAGSSIYGGGDDLFGVTTGGGAFGMGAVWGLSLTVPAGGLGITAPASAVDGTAMSPPVTVAIFDQLNNQMNSASTATVAVESGASGVLTGTLTQPFINGVATFSDLKFNSVQGMQQLTATSPAVSGTGISGEINVSLPAAGTTMSLIASSNPISAGQVVAFVATVTAGSGSPTGTVTFMDGSTLIGTVAINSTTHQAIAFTGSLPVGSNSIKATYNGASGFTTSSAFLTETVSPAGAATTTALTASANPITAGQVVAFVATVTAGSGSPTGTVTFMDGSTLIGTATINSTTHQAVAFTASLPVGSNSIKTTYNGASGFAVSSASLTETVNPAGAATTTALTASANPIDVGQVVAFVATVTSGSGSPTGTVTFMDGSTLIGTAAIDSTTHQAVAFTASLLAGSNSITAMYNGASGFATSSGLLTETVNSA
jgi:hypothetical protein